MKLQITYVDEKTKTIIRKIELDCPKIKNEIAKMNFCERMANNHKRNDEVLIGWKLIKEEK